MKQKKQLKRHFEDFLFGVEETGFILKSHDNELSIVNDHRFWGRKIRKKLNQGRGRKEKYREKNRNLIKKTNRQKDTKEEFLVSSIQFLLQLASFEYFNKTENNNKLTEMMVKLHENKKEKKKKKKKNRKVI